ncbi:MAG: histidinol dehydrogenase [Sphaerochaetaceae bacterium]|nr:histidinol dehydrogenase [Sphaerochaetaceae bacterium]MDC7248603.1 histidinol dehydrogenase [Sphaerochaetaceae bacterium]
MIPYYYKPKETDLETLLSRELSDDFDVEKSVKDIILNVKENGDKALYHYAEKFDNVVLDNLYVSEEEFNNCDSKVSDELKTAIKRAKSNIEKFHEAQLPKGEFLEVEAGIQLSRKIVSINSVGLYIPGGTAPLFSTVLMLGVPAKVANVKNIILATPPTKDGSVNPVVLYTAKTIGINKVIKVGGASAIAALSYGTETIKKVDKIFGPGNRFVSYAKMLVSSRTSIDMLAGPSEVMVVIDKNTNLRFAASDFLSQAEHGRDSQSVLLILANESESFTLKNNFIKEIEKQLDQLDRKEYLLPSLNNSKILATDNFDDCIKIIDNYAPEHLVLNLELAKDICKEVSNAGSIFIGPYACESAGDYASGTNHTLPTSGWAKSVSGVSIDSFIKKITIQEISRSGLQSLGKTIITMAEGESLSAHANSVKIRLEEK